MEILMKAENQAGSFLVRPSERFSSHFCLSIKYIEKDGEFNVKNYKISSINNGEGYYLVEGQIYGSLQAFVIAHSSKFIKFSCFLIICSENS